MELAESLGRGAQAGTARPLRARSGVVAMAATDARTGASASAAPAMPKQQEFVAALAFDLETTGLDVRRNEIVQIAIVVANSNKGAKFSRLVLPEGPIDPGASAVHGFTREFLIAHGARPFGEVWDECEAWISATLGSDTRPLVWCAHNGRSFDQPVLTRCVDELYQKRAAEARTSADGERGGEGGGKEKAGEAEGGEAAVQEQQQEEERRRRSGLPPSPASLSPLLRYPRAVWIDTLELARRALPRRPRGADGLGPHTLGSLYFTASGGESLAGAHDALADAQALALVWKWLVTDVGADGRSTAWTMPAAAADDGDEGAATKAAGANGAAANGMPSLFQAHLQYHGYRLHEVLHPAPQAARGSARRGASGAAGNTISTSEDPDLASLMRISGIGPALAQRLRGKGVGSYEELEARWKERGHAKMLSWMTHSMPGVDVRVLRKAVKGMGAEWGSPP